MQDYSKQLEQIANALNRPSTPAWILSLGSAALGFVFGLLGQQLQVWLGNRRDEKAMRRVLYQEIGTSYIFAFQFNRNIKKSVALQDPQWQVGEVKKRITFQGEDYLHEHSAVFARLPEQIATRNIYIALHQIGAQEGRIEQELGNAVNRVAMSIWQGNLRLKYFKKYLMPEMFKVFKSHYEQERLRLEDIGRFVHDLLTPKPPA